jgi:hypothetical protein
MNRCPKKLICTNTLTGWKEEECRSVPRALPDLYRDIYGLEYEGLYECPNACCGHVYDGNAQCLCMCGGDCDICLEAKNGGAHAAPALAIQVPPSPTRTILPHPPSGTPDKKRPLSKCRFDIQTESVEIIQKVWRSYLSRKKRFLYGYVFKWYIANLVWRACVI